MVTPHHTPDNTPDNNTLHLLAAAPYAWAHVLPQILAAWRHGDTLLLLAAGAQGWANTELARFGTVGILQHEATQIDIIEKLNHVQVIDCATWANWVTQHQRCITWAL